MSTDGILSGTPVKLGTSQIALTVIDSAGRRASVSRRLKVPKTLPAACIDSPCAVLTPSARTVQVPGTKIVGITRNATTGALATVTLTGITVAGGAVLVLAPTPAIESGAVVYVQTVSANPDGTSTASVTPTTPADAFTAGTVKTSESNATTTIAPASAPPPAFSIAPASAAVNVAASNAVPNQLASPQRSALATPSPTMKCEETKVEPDLTAGLTAIWKHPIAGAGGVYVGTGGLSLFQVDLDTVITLKLGILSEQKDTCTLTLPEVKRLVPAGELGAVVIAEQPKFSVSVSSKVDITASVTLHCSTEYRWESGAETRLSYCRTTYEPLQIRSDTGVDTVLTGTVDVRVSLDDIVGITGQFTASLHAGYHPTTHPVAVLDFTAAAQLGACLDCFFHGSPAHVTIVKKTFFQNKILASWDTAPPPPPGPLQITTTSLPTGTVGQPYRAVLNATGGTAPYAWTVNNGQLPVGLVLDRLTGIITGTPTSPGTSTIIAGVKDTAGMTAAFTATVTIQPSATGLTGVQKVATDSYTVYAVTTNGAVWDWGQNDKGQLGNGTATSTNATLPMEVAGLTGVKDISTDYWSTLALKSDGTVWAWGFNSKGQLGNGTTTNSSVPVQVTGLTGVQSIVAHFYSAYALKSDGTVWGWGMNGVGQLGNGTRSDSSVPVQVPGLAGVQKITADGNTVTALKTDGTVWDWGLNFEGNLGNGTTIASSVPVQVTGLTGVRDITPDILSTFAVKADGTVWAWGSNNTGQLGDGTTANATVPVQVTGLDGVQNVSASGSAVFALKTDGTVRAWGGNFSGQLGNTTTADSTIPVQVAGLSGVQSVSGSDLDSVLAVKTDGTLWTWGDNRFGELGNGTTTNSAVPMEVPTLTGVQSAAAAPFQAFAITSAGNVWAWGDNRLGLLGNGTTASSAVPVRVG